MLRRLRRITQGRLQRSRESIGDVIEVGEEDHVEQAALTDLRDMLIEFRARPTLLIESALGMPPHAKAVIARPVHEKLR